MYYLWWNIIQSKQILSGLCIICGGTLYNQNRYYQVYVLFVVEHYTIKTDIIRFMYYQILQLWNFATNNSKIWYKVNFKAKLVWIQSFPSLKMVALSRWKRPFCHTIYPLPIVGGRTSQFMLFSGALALSEKQTASSRIWTQVSDSIPYACNSYIQCICNTF